ncbi:MAG: hypothetical protein KUL82_09580 [Bdellovibrio sp.]|uniref:hypothetical protein n=1 Tax=Bdellovibrio sp. TaxID=28201 RepID=UPI0039E3624D|nr:hypothetical protein [Bdellovibrio sp.]
MKTLIAALLFVVAGPAMAQENGLSSQSEDFTVDFISWCENNSVMMQNSDGSVYERANCSDQGLSCKTFQMHRLHKTIYTAACVEKN